MSLSLEERQTAAIPSKRPTVLHVVAGLDASHGGPSYSVPRLAAAQGAAGAQVILASVAGAGEPAVEAAMPGYREVRARWDAARVPALGTLRLSGGLRRAVEGCCASGAVVHVHGLWRMPNVTAPRAAARHGRPVVLSPRGMLAAEALAFSPRQKSIFWRLLQGPALRHLACLHATGDAEVDEIRGFGLTAPVAVVPNGVDLPDLSAPRPVREDGLREVLYLGRLHPKKGLDVLVRAWARLPGTTRDGWRLRIVGPSEQGHGQALAALAASLGLHDVDVEKPIFGDEKFTAYRRADLFVLPTRNENFGLTVAEALASGTPVICTRGAPWGGLEAQRCGWWVPHGPEAMAAALSTSMAMPEAERRVMGGRGRAWMKRDFSWDSVAARLLDVCRWLDAGGEPPACVRRD